MKLLCFFLLCLCSQALVSPRGNNCTDQLALLSFKSMLSSGPSSLLASWNTSNHFCSWPGVVCGHQQPVRVIALRMGTFNLSGLISPFLGNLSFLKELDLHGNQLVGKIPPELGHLGGLQVLNVSLNYLQGSIPVTLQVCAKLTSLDLSNNYLQGEIPSEMGTLKKLVFLNLEKNGLSGEIPQSLAGCFPSEIWLCTTIDYLLDNNFFDGIVPPEVGRLGALDWLQLNSNSLKAKEPKDWDFLSALTNCSQLQALQFSNNKFGGFLPRSLSNLSASLTTLILDGNTISGSIPEDIALFILLMLLKLLICRRKRKINTSTNSMQGYPMISYSQLVSATNGFSAINFLGSGSFGAVYKGELSGEEVESTKLIAVKVLKLQTPKAHKSFTTECEALRNTRHRNLVKIITICSGIDSTWDDFKAIVYDFMPNGSLESWLHQDANDHQAEQRYLNIYDRVTILLDVAYALDYLHCHGLKPVVHCDLKSSNVLLDADMVAHVGDFGLAKILVKRSSSLQQSTSSMGFRGTIGYAAPG
ncbi:hypothetical protein HU200_038143 [Digitaria exilis]|uniref:Protein kinase domain-containing protein n=1 Tax=Digitaria exilis TaxID=1010633 RepID=A0A835BKX2_9POAL|nr:hypothetical protein HU200_038143 [Digitaria exilis]